MERYAGRDRKEIVAPQNTPASFRDPSGFVFTKNGVLYRQINRAYAAAYDALMSSGLYAELVRRNYLVPHEEVAMDKDAAPELYKIIKPERIPFISYPYEWCFGELKDAALLTLKIQKLALRHGMWLKDASAYNIQFRNGRPILIDTISFERYKEGIPWIAYRQFCRHFLAPLDLMSFTDARLSQLSRIHIDGIPLDLTSALLPWKSWLRPAVFFHIHMHAKSERHFSGEKINLRGNKFSRSALDGLVEGLFSGIAALQWNPKRNEAADGREEASGSSVADGEISIIEQFIDAARPGIIWKFGMNDELFGKIANRHGAHIVAFDADQSLVEKKYLAVRERKESRLLPLLLDLANPSPSLGWANNERASLAARGPADLVLALNLIHRLAISNNVPFPMIAEFFASICKALVVEFIPKGDRRIEHLLRNRMDIFDSYDNKNFEAGFGRYFEINDSRSTPSSKRTLYLMRKKSGTNVATGRLPE